MLGTGGSHPASQHPEAPVRDGDGIERDGRSGRRDADDDERAAAAQDGTACLDEAAHAGGDEHMIRATAPGQLGDRVRGVLDGRVDHMGGPERAGGLEFRGDAVGRDDLLGTRQHRALDAVEPDTAGAEHDDGTAGFDRRGVHDGTDPCQDPAGEQAGRIEGNGRRNGNHLGRVHGDEPRESARPHPLVDSLPGSAGQDRVHVCGRKPLTEGGLAPLASGAPAAGPDQRDDNVVTGREPAHAWSGLFHHARGLVAVDGRERAAPRAVDESDIAVADGAGGDADEDLPRSRGADGHLLDLERRPEGPAHGSSHRVARLSRTAGNGASRHRPARCPGRAAR